MVKKTVNTMNKSTRIIFFATFLFSAFLFKPSAANAQSAKLTIIPPKFELYSNPGESLSEVIRVRNESDAPMTYSISVEDFTTSGEEGQVILEEGETDTSYSLAKWIEPSTKDLVLQPNEEKAFSFLINTPRNAEPGGHYASVLFKTGGGKVESGASVSNRVGSLVLLRVSGNVVEDAALETFSAPSLSQKSPIAITLRMKNSGTAHIIPKGTIVITNMFGKKVDEIPLSGRNVLPGATRKMDTMWEKDKLFGSYTATLIATYGQQNKAITAVTKFSVISKSSFAIGFVGLFLVIGLIMTIIVGRERFSKILSVMFKG